MPVINVTPTAHRTFKAYCALQGRSMLNVASELLEDASQEGERQNKIPTELYVKLRDLTETLGVDFHDATFWDSVVSDIKASWKVGTE